eukprot:6291298-Ditylum_brightwellii.AAC.1
MAYPSLKAREYGTKQSHDSLTADLWFPPEETDALLDGEEIDEMMEIMIPEEEWDKWEEKVTVVRLEAFPYLDMK